MNHLRNRFLLCLPAIAACLACRDANAPIPPSARSPANQGVPSPTAMTQQPPAAAAMPATPGAPPTAQPALPPGN